MMLFEIKMVEEESVVTDVALSDIRMSLGSSHAAFHFGTRVSGARNATGEALG